MRHMEQVETAQTGATVFVAMELSKMAWLLAVQGSPSGRASSHRLDGGDVDGLLALLRRLAAREQGASGEKEQVVLGYEAGYDGFWLHRRLAAEGIACWVMDPGSLQVDRRARRAKTDRLDAVMLLRALTAWCRGDRAACRMVQVPSAEREDARRTHRERQRLIAERVQHVNRIKRLLATQCIHDHQPLRRDRRERLGALRTGDGLVLPPCLRREIEREFLRLELVREQIVAVEAERDTAVAAPATDDADVAKVALLAKLGGIGTELATVLVREALYRPFANRKEVASYAGLTPSPFASGDRHRDQGISKAGYPLLRKSMVELAWLWLRYQPGTALAQWFTKRVGEICGRIRKISAVALARKLLVALWRYVTTGLVPEDARLKPAAA
ncbi:Transposase [Roseomonas mucosa]|uniref:Transposase n=2 Tax=Roseomonas mucosa TaxID=207340 RepID=A0A379PNT3_9PROT|nr:Transposase [Roseomonas mucosa]